MKNIILSGANGKMGHVISELVYSRDDCEIIAGVDINTEKYAGFEIKSSFDGLEKADVIIDFSNPAVLKDLLGFAKKTKTPVVLATTGYDEEDKKQIEQAAKEIPVFFTFNMSLGVNLIASLAQKAVSILGDSFDVEIIEKHHSQKIDAPSGTALMLADALNEQVGGTYEYVYDRHSKREKRGKKELGLHAVRGGTIVGEHDILFSGRDEIITLSHSARSKEIFAVGAVNAAVFLSGKGKAAGMYDMNDLISEQ